MTKFQAVSYLDEFVIVTVARKEMTMGKDVSSKNTDEFRRK